MQKYEKLFKREAAAARLTKTLYPGIFLISNSYVCRKCWKCIGHIILCKLRYKTWWLIYLLL